MLVAAIAVSATLLGHWGGGRKLAQSLTLGALFGIVLQRSRFCFFCHARDFIQERDARGVAAILLAIAVGTLGYHVVFGAWLPDPSGGRLPPDAHVGPVGPVLALAAFAFGVGMTISGSCISGHLYRLGEGSPTAPFALVGTILGFMLGFSTWNSLYLLFVATAQVVWLPTHLGYAGWLIGQLAILAALAILIAIRARAPAAARDEAASSALAHTLRRLFVDRWPATVGGAAVGVIATVAYFQVQPLGVTAALGSLARAISGYMGLLPETLHGLDGFSGCRTAIAAALSPNAAFVGGLVAGSFASAFAAGQFAPAVPTAAQALRGTLGGVLLGWGAMTALGCTVGTPLSGTMAGAASGWVFLAASFAGLYLTLRLSSLGGSRDRRR